MQSDDLKIMFDPCVNRTLELIDEQAAAVYERGARVKVRILQLNMFMLLMWLTP